MLGRPRVGCGTSPALAVPRGRHAARRCAGPLLQLCSGALVRFSWLARGSDLLAGRAEYVDVSRPGRLGSLLLKYVAFCRSLCLARHRKEKAENLPGPCIETLTCERSLE